MITGDIKLGIQYRDLILEQIRREIKPSDAELQRMRGRINRSSSDELERVYEAFERFGVYAMIVVKTR